MKTEGLPYPVPSRDQTLSPANLPPPTPGESRLRIPPRAWGRVERLLPGHRCEVVLANGYRADAYFDRHAPRPYPVLVPGDAVYLEFSTYDLSCPRILPSGPPLPDDGSPSQLHPGPDRA